MRHANARTDWLKRLRLTFPNLKFSNQFIANGNTLVGYRCPKHGPGVMRANLVNDKRHKKRLGCQHCKGEHSSTYVRTRKGGSPEISWSEWLSRFRSTHKNKYQYVKPEGRVQLDTLIRIRCRKHGEFVQDAEHHVLSVHGCGKCFTETKRSSEYMWRQKFQSIYGNKFSYKFPASVENCYTIIEVKCPIHGVFNSSIKEHAYSLTKIGCSRCGRDIRAARIFLRKHTHIDDTNWSLECLQELGKKVIRHNLIKALKKATDNPTSKTSRNTLRRLKQTIHSLRGAY